MWLPGLGPFIGATPFCKCASISKSAPHNDFTGDIKNPPKKSSLQALGAYFAHTHTRFTELTCEIAYESHTSGIFAGSCAAGYPIRLAAGLFACSCGSALCQVRPAAGFSFAHVARLCASYACSGLRPPAIRLGGSAGGSGDKVSAWVIQCGLRPLIPAEGFSCAHAR